MTSYTPQDLGEDWEFKILRANTGAFRKPEVLRSVLTEEAKAGWQLVEKFDDNRLRLKRPGTAKTRDAQLSFDPYRTRYGISDLQLASMIVGAVLTGVTLILMLVWALTR